MYIQNWSFTSKSVRFFLCNCYHTILKEGQNKDKTISVSMMTSTVTLCLCEMIMIKLCFYYRAAGWISSLWTEFLSALCKVAHFHTFNRQVLPFFSLTLECEPSSHSRSCGRVQTVARRPTDWASHTAPEPYRARGLNPMPFSLWHICSKNIKAASSTWSISKRSAAKRMDSCFINVMNLFWKNQDMHLSMSVQHICLELLQWCAIDWCNILSE